MTDQGWYGDDDLEVDYYGPPPDDDSTDTSVDYVPEHEWFNADLPDLAVIQWPMPDFTFEEMYDADAIQDDDDILLAADLAYLAETDTQEQPDIPQEWKYWEMTPEQVAALPEPAEAPPQSGDIDPMTGEVIP